MSKIVWDESFSVYDEELDRQHRRLIEIYNKLYGSLISDNVDEMNAKKLETLNQLLDYTVNHFELEEQFMESTNYPELAEHRKLHLELADKIRALHRDLKANKTVLSTSLMKLLRDWIVSHIGHEDKKIGIFNQQTLASHG